MPISPREMSYLWTMHVQETLNRHHRPFGGGCEKHDCLRWLAFDRPNDRCTELRSDACNKLCVLSKTSWLDGTMGSKERLPPDPGNVRNAPPLVPALPGRSLGKV